MPQAPCTLPTLGTTAFARSRMGRSRPRPAMATTSSRAMAAPPPAPPSGIPSGWPSIPPAISTSATTAAIASAKSPGATSRLWRVTGTSGSRVMAARPPAPHSSPRMGWRLTPPATCSSPTRTHGFEGSPPAASSRPWPATGLPDSRGTEGWPSMRRSPTPPPWPWVAGCTSPTLAMAAFARYPPGTSLRWPAMAPCLRPWVTAAWPPKRR